MGCFRKKFFVTFFSTIIFVAFSAFPASASDEGGFGDFWDDATLGFRAIYYGRDRDNHGTDSNGGEIDVDAFGYGLDFRSGYGWGFVGFDASLVVNLGSGDGNSEVLKYDINANSDSSSASYREAALKLKFGCADGALSFRGGYTPIRIGTIGTSAGINPHGYRGIEAKWQFGDWELGYGWADRFHNDWDDRFRRMTNKWHQNRDGYDDGGQIDYIHSFGARYVFGPDKAGFVDIGVGKGRDFRKNAQIAVFYPRKLRNDAALDLTGYFIWGKYNEKLAYDFTTNASDEYHFSASARYTKGPWSFMLGYGQTDADDSKEMQFRLTPWANSDNRNFIQTWAQLDDFVWNGEKVIKISATYDLSDRIFPGMPGLRLGVSFNYGWDIESYDSRGTIYATEFDLGLEYVPTEGPFKGWSAGIYPAWLRFEDDDFYGKPSRDDVKFIVGFNHTLDFREVFGRYARSDD